MRSRYRRYIGQLIAVLAVLLLQLGLTHLDMQLQDRLRNGQFGTETFLVALSTVFLGILSGVILGLALGAGAQGGYQRCPPLPGALILSIIPVVAIAYRLLLVATRTFVFFPIRRYRWLFWRWLSGSQVPTLWLGLVIGWFAGQRLDD